MKCWENKEDFFFLIVLFPVCQPHNQVEKHIPKKSWETQSDLISIVKQTQHCECGIAGVGMEGLGGERVNYLKAV